MVVKFHKIRSIRNKKSRTKIFSNETVKEEVFGISTTSKALQKKLNALLRISDLWEQKKRLSKAA